MGVREPVWTAELQNRQRGETTFQLCGWCAYASGGACRYNAYLETECSLMPRYAKERKVYFDTPCKIKQLGADDLREYAERQRNDATEARQSANRYDDAAAVLLGESEVAEPIPVGPENRAYNHFNIGDRVRVYHDGTWRRATVVNGYRHHDGMVSFCEDGEKHEPGRSPGCGLCVPSVMLESEAQYFEQHPVQFEDWLARADREYNGHRFDVGEMLVAFAATAAEDE